MTTKEILFETLNDLTSEEFEVFKSFIESETGFPPISRKRLKLANTQNIVDLMEETYGQECLRLAIKVLRKMNKTDLVQRIQEKTPVDKQQLSLIRRVERMASVIELLLETLADLSEQDLKRFKEMLSEMHFYRRYSNISSSLLETTDMQDIVFLMARNFGQQSVERTKTVLMRMNGTDLVQRLSSSRPRPQKKYSMDGHFSALIHKVATMAAVKELLLDTLNDLTSEELKNLKWFLQFAFFQRSLPYISWEQMYEAITAEVLVDVLVDVLVEISGQKSVDVTMEVFMDMNRTDLVQRLSESSSGLKVAGSSAEAFPENTTKEEKHSLYEHLPALIQKVERISSLIELLLDTLKDLNDEELSHYKRVLLRQADFHGDFSDISWMLLGTTDLQDIAFLTVQTFGQQALERTIARFKARRRTNRLQWLLPSSFRRKMEHSADKHPSTLIQRVATIPAVKELLLETLSDLSYEELEKFKDFLQLIATKKNLKDIRIFRITGLEETVNLMVRTYGQQSVELTRKVLIDIEKPDLVQRLAMPSSGLKEGQSVDEYQPTMKERAEAMPAVKKILFKKLEDLSHVKFKKFKWLLQFTYFQRSLPQIPWSELDEAESPHMLVDLMVESHGQQSVEVTEDVFMDMNITETSSGLGVKHQDEDECKPALVTRKVTMTSLHKTLLETLQKLSKGDLEMFKHVLLYSKIKEGLPRIPREEMETAGRFEIVVLMVEVYGQQSLEVTMEVFKKMNRKDLMQMFSDISSGSRGRSLEHEGRGGLTQDFSGWTKLEPEVNRTGAEEAPIYSLQSEAGNFECSVSGLRWFCKDKVSFKYQFCSWEEPMKRMESMKYMPAGPLIDITVIAGKLDEVYLPHWICIDDNPKISDKFAVLHINDCGDDLEKVSEVTTSHVKLLEPVFSLRGTLIEMKAGLSAKISCNVLIYYQPNTPFLKLHVYLIPNDQGLKQTVDRNKSPKGYKAIDKPGPNEYLRLQRDFILTADVDTAKIQPKERTLRHEYNEQNFYEVFIKNPQGDFNLTLLKARNKKQKKFKQVWTCEIREDDYQNAANLEENQSVDENLSALMQKKATITTDREKLKKTLGHLKQEELKEFKSHLQDEDFLSNLPCIPTCQLEKTDMLDLVNLMLQTYPKEYVALTKKIFKKLNRNDLVQKL